MIIRAIIFSLIRISMDESEDHILFIGSFELSKVSRYCIVVTVAYFDYDKECILSIIGIIISCDLVMYVFVFPMKINVLVFCYYARYNKWCSHFRHHLDKGIGPFLVKDIYFESSIRFWEGGVKIDIINCHDG